nr:histidine kinase dimerization/phospho-acceptor domain-containing protein [Sphingomonas daechungensis]
MNNRRPIWFGQLPLTRRILAVNLLTIVLLALGVLYLDAFRNQLSEERLNLISREAGMVAGVLAATPEQAQDSVLTSLARSTGSRIRVYGPDGSLQADSWNVTGPTYTLRDPTLQKWNKDAARALDRGFNALVGASPLDDFIEPTDDRVEVWSEAVHARETKQAVTKVRNAPDLTPVFSAAAPVGDRTVLLTTNDRDFTRIVRSQRRSLFAAMAFATLLSVLLSLFLARTIVRPLRRLALAAHRVRLGRAREVKVPRLPSRIDEIGLLARAVSDMSQSLRHRMDNIEHFAADVTHELKNPLASLRSALDGLERVDDPELKAKLLMVAKDDVVRLDRLIGDISEAARTDAELARARFEPVDLGPVIEQLVNSWEHRREKGDARIAFARPRKSSAVVLGDVNRLVRAIDNIIDNAISFSPRVDSWRLRPRMSATKSGSASMTKAQASLKTRGKPFLTDSTQ